jgi:SAM-dependent methyltransferase
VTDFAAVDAGDGHDLVAMMEATDAWPAVEVVRRWVLERAGTAAGSLVVDVGCGPGTFGAAAAARGAAILDVDVSFTMLRAARDRGACRPVLGDISALGLRDRCAQLVRTERVLQWTADPDAGLAELRRVTAPGGWLAVTDTDWGTLVVDHPDRSLTERVAAAALEWVPHPRFARDLPASFDALDLDAIAIRHDTVMLGTWDPDDPAQRDGPPGLPLRAIAPHDVDAVEMIADRARGRDFRAELGLVTVMARRS